MKLVLTVTPAEGDTNRNA